MVFSTEALPDFNFNQEVLLVTNLLLSSYLHPANSRQFLPPSCLKDYFGIEFPVCGGEIGPLSIVLVPFSNHEAEALHVLCCVNILVSTLGVAMMLVIHRARVCADTDLCGFLSWMNILMASV